MSAGYWIRGSSSILQPINFDTYDIYYSRRTLYLCNISDSAARRSCKAACRFTHALFTSCALPPAC
eukprot:458213-Prymnesium_polylepis.1